MKDTCAKKAVAASLSLTLALGSVPAVALADNDANADEQNEVAAQVATDNIPATSKSATDAPATDKTPATDAPATDKTPATDAPATDSQFVQVTFKAIGAPEAEVGTLTVKAGTTPEEAYEQFGGFSFEGYKYDGLFCSNLDTNIDANDPIPAGSKNTCIYIYFVADPKGAPDDKPAATDSVNVKVVNHYDNKADDEGISGTGVFADSPVTTWYGDKDGYDVEKVTDAAGKELKGTAVVGDAAVDGLAEIHVHYKIHRQPEVKTSTVNFVAIFDDGDQAGKKQSIGSRSGIEVGTALSSLDLLPGATFDGYTFTGKCSATATSDSLTDQDVVKEGDNTIYFHYKANPSEVVKTGSITYKAIFEGGELNGKTQEIGGCNGVEAGTLLSGLTLPGATFEGYTFTGNYSTTATGNGLTDQDVVKEGENIVYLHYKADEQAPAEEKTADIRLVAIFEGGNLDGVMDEFYSAKGVKVGTAIASLDTHAVPGYTFNGYSDANTGLDIADDATVAEGMSTVYVHYKANEEIKTVDLKFVALFEGGDRNGESEEFASAEGVRVGDKISNVVPGHTVDGYVFSNYAIGTSEIAGDAEVTEDMKTIYVCYKADETKAYGVSYDFADGSDPRTARFVLKDSEMAAGYTGWLGLFTPQRDGYEFQGWAYKDGDGTILADDTALPNQEQTEVVAQWKKIETPAEKITVKFVDSFNNTESSVEIEKGETVSQPANPSYDGYTFEGWSSTLKDESNNWLYTPVDFTQAVEDADGDGVVTYYAFYTEDEKPGNGADNGATNQTTDNGNAVNADNQASDQASDDQAGSKDSSSSEAPQTGDATNAAAVAGIGGIAGFLAAAAAFFRRRHNN